MAHSGLSQLALLACTLPLDLPIGQLKPPKAQPGQAHAPSNLRRSKRNQWPNPGFWLLGTTRHCAPTSHPRWCVKGTSKGRLIRLPQPGVSLARYQTANPGNSMPALGTLPYHLEGHRGRDTEGTILVKFGAPLPPRRSSAPFCRALDSQRCHNRPTKNAHRPNHTLQRQLRHPRNPMPTSATTRSSTSKQHQESSQKTSPYWEHTYLR